MESKENNNVLPSNEIPSFEIKKSKEDIFFDKLFIKMMEYKEIDKDSFSSSSSLLKSFFSQKKRLMTWIESCQNLMKNKSRNNLVINHHDYKNALFSFLLCIFKERQIIDLSLYLIEKIVDLKKIGINIEEEEAIKEDIETAFNFTNDHLFPELFKIISVSFANDDDYRKNIIFKINNIFFQLKDITDFDSKISNLKEILIKKDFVKFGSNFKMNVMDYFLKNFVDKIDDIHKLIDLLGEEEEMNSEDIKKISNLIIDIILSVQKGLVKNEIIEMMKESQTEESLIIFNDFL